MFAKRLVILCFSHPNLIFLKLAFILYTGFFPFCSIGNHNSFRFSEPGANFHMQDTVFIRKGRYMLTKNTSITIPRDTFYIVHPKKMKRTEADYYQHSQVFYDTLYKKFSRKKITQLLYALAFAAPQKSELPDTLQVLKSAKPFEKFRGKVIRNIRIKILPPFGANVYDTGRYAETGIGKALNGVHINTRKYVIRRNLLFKKGDKVNPAIMADNERLLRNISSIDNARIIIAQSDRGSD